MEIEAWRRDYGNGGTGSIFDPPSHSTPIFTADFSKKSDAGRQSANEQTDFCHQVTYSQVPTLPLYSWNDQEEQRHHDSVIERHG